MNRCLQILLQIHLYLGLVAFFAIFAMHGTTIRNPNKRSAAAWEEWWRKIMPGTFLSPSGDLGTGLV